MTVIPLRRRPGRARVRPVPAAWPEASVRGTFRAPSGRTGTMTGSLRVERFVFASDRLWAVGVFAGMLCDADGSHIATGSRRHAAPAVVAGDLEGSPTVIGPVEVDLVGLAVSIPTFTVGTSEGLTAIHGREPEEPEAGGVARGPTALTEPT